MLAGRTVQRLYGVFNKISAWLVDKFPHYFSVLVALHPDKRVKLLIKCLIHVNNVKYFIRVVNFHRNLKKIKNVKVV